MAARAARRRDVGARLERTLIASAAAQGCTVAVIEAHWVPWASVTFTGARHQLALTLAPTPAAEAWLAALPDLELPLPGHLVADLQVASRAADDDRLNVVLEALTVEEC
ncbi:hypothetical protein [Sphingomonas sp.]|uniref:hypothetical protein n=1 Tax=Sphingomonas sp. TaxID=28214 RepID=UPI002FDA9D56